MNIACPHCRGLVADTPQLRGRVIACPHCGGHFAMPDLAATQERPLPSPQQASHAERPIPGPGAGQERPLAPPSTASQAETPLASPSALPIRPAAAPRPAGPSSHPTSASPGSASPAPVVNKPAPQTPAAAPPPPRRPAPHPAPPRPNNPGYAAAAPIQAQPVQATPIQAAPTAATPVQPTPIQAAPVQATPVAAAPVQPVHPPASGTTAAGAGKPGSTLLEQRRARQRGSALKTILLLLFGLMATGFTIVLIVFLWGYSTFEDYRQESQGKYDQARTVAAQQLRSMDGMVLEPQADIQFYEDGCIVSGTARTRTQSRVPVEVSIGIYENKVRSTWMVETVVVDGKTVYSRDYN